MTRFFRLLGLALACPSLVFAQQAPIAGRPVDYSNIEGVYTIKTSAEPTTVHVEEAIALRIEIVGAGPAEFEPDRRYLKLFPDKFEDDFYVREMRDQHRVDRATKTWLFVYRLKPKHAKVNAITDIKLHYFNLDKKRFVPKYADDIQLKVSPKPEAPGPDVPISAVPDSFFEITEGRDVVSSVSSFTLTDAQFACLLAVPPFLCLAGAWGWRRWFPDEALRAKAYRLGAAARALASLQSGRTDARGVVCRYLQERFDLTVAAPTPAEVYAFFKRRGFAIALCSQSQAFFQACDAARYTEPARQDPRQLADAATRLIQALEADPCA